MKLKSQEMRKLAPELDPLRIGTGWKKEDLDKVQVMVESTYGDSHPGSGHLNVLVEEVRKGIAEEGGFGARYYCTDICDGESQGTDGINYSLASREIIANMIEIHANATPFDAGVYLSSCDKGVPGNLIGLFRVNIPSVFVPGGTMNAGPEMLTLEQLGMYSAKFERGEIDEEKLDWAKCNACPSCGACSFIGTASTMQIMAEALGLTLPGSALMPATSPDLLAFAREAGRQSVRLAQMEHMRPSDIVTKDSFENAILVHAAISGSTNCLLHIPAIAHELVIEITGDTFDSEEGDLIPYIDVLFGIEPYHLWKDEQDHQTGDVKDGVPFQPDFKQQDEVFHGFVKRYSNIECIARHVRYAHSCSENSLMAYLWYDGKTYENQKLRVHILDRVSGGDAFVSGIIYASMAGGLPCAEVTFRTQAAKESIRLMAEEYPDMLVGAGTVLTTTQVDEAMEAGAKFIVSPGFDPEIVDYCQEKGIKIFPGCVSPSEVAQAVKKGLKVVKFFPAEQAGGSWMVKGDLVKAGDFDKIEQLTKEAKKLAQGIR